MGEVDIQRIEDIEPYSGKNAIPGIRFRPAARKLGVTAWGMSVIELDPGCGLYPEHDHQADGQEEVYVILRGQAVLHAQGQQQTLAVGSMVRVGPREKRKFVPGPDGVTLLAIGATPGKAYEPRR
jgi:mannose-6-phosphate isomerase-like protein (cupin superfamily)